MGTCPSPYRFDLTAAKQLYLERYPKHDDPTYVDTPEWWGKQGPRTFYYGSTSTGITMPQLYNVVVSIVGQDRTCIQFAFGPLSPWRVYVRAGTGATWGSGWKLITTIGSLADPGLPGPEIFDDPTSADGTYNLEEIEGGGLKAPIKLFSERRLVA